jgi:DNA primase
MNRGERRAERIRLEVPIEQVLANYGFEVRVQGGAREQQFRCSLHGDGNDGKPSARCYPENNSWYCWACGRSRDAIQTVREKEGLSFHASLERLERMFTLPSLPWEDGDNQEAPTDPLAGAFDRPERTFEDEARRVGRLIAAICTERALALALVLGLAEDYDRIVNQAEANPDDAMGSLEKLRYRIQAVMGMA